MTQPSTPGRSSGTAVGFLVTLALLVVVLGWLFSDSFKPGVTLFSNDAPLGAHTADQVKTPGAFTGVWHDLNWLGANGGSYPADLTFGALYLLGPVGYSKFHAPLALLILGLSAWAMCTALGFRRPVAILTGLAAALNMNAFSNACWGLSCWPLAWAMSFLAVAAVLAGEIIAPPEVQGGDTLAQRASQLTPQQWRVLALMVQGDQNKQIAYKLGVGEPTVKAHVTVILRKLGVRSRTQAVIEARGLALPPA